MEARNFPKLVQGYTKTKTG